MSERKDVRKDPCRHRKVWIYAVPGASELSGLAWCYECGAIRSNAAEGWTRPVGKGGENPALKLMDRKRKTTVRKLP